MKTFIIMTIILITFFILFFKEKKIVTYERDETFLVKNHLNYIICAKISNDGIKRLYVGKNKKGYYLTNNLQKAIVFNSYGEMKNIMDDLFVTSNENDFLYHITGCRIHGTHLIVESVLNYAKGELIVC